MDKGLVDDFDPGALALCDEIIDAASEELTALGSAKRVSTTSITESIASRDVA